jgi:hypothetical protein
MTPPAASSNSSPPPSATRIPFFAWCDRNKLGGLADIEPLRVAAYVEALQRDYEKPSVKQHLAAIRMCFDWLVTGGILAIYQSGPRRGPKQVVRRGKTTVLTGEQARELLDSIDTTTLVGLRDRTLISVMVFAFARIGAHRAAVGRGLGYQVQGRVFARNRVRREARRRGTAIQSDRAEGPYSA